MSTVAITGAGGYIARQLISSLENQKWCHRILGTDIVEPDIESAKLEFRNCDIRDPSLFDCWKDEGVDTVVHLAFIVDPIHD
jgi:UDP-glucose 4-epimerase